MKTIFVSLFPDVVVDNFSIPGGVLEQLVKNKKKDTRVVFLLNNYIFITHNFLQEKLEHFLDENVIIELIKKIPPSGFVQKLFHFFYSYLIFTSTTKILATFGTKANTPPAGRNRHLAFLKSLIANTFGRSKFIKTKFAPWAFKGIFSSRPYKYLFDKYNPELIVLPSLAFFPDIELLAESKRRNIKTIGMVFNWDHLNKYYIPLRADTFLVQNEPMRDEAVYLQSYDKEKVFTVGFPQFDIHARYQQYIFHREPFFKKFGIPLDSKLIVFISGAAYSLDEPDILRTISQWIKENRFKLKISLMIRPYVTKRDTKKEEEKFKDFKNDPVIFFNSLNNSENLEYKRYYISMLYYADIIISIFSTTAIEAAIFNKPTLTIGFDGYKKRPSHQTIARLEKMSHFKHILDTGSVKVTRSFPDLFESIDQYLKFPQKDKEKREFLVQKMCYKIDGLSSKRITDFILGQAEE